MDDEYFACSQYKELGKGMPPNNLAYYLSGSRTSVKSVQLNLNVNNKSEAKAAHNELVKALVNLSMKASGVALPKEVRTAVLSGTKGEWKSGKFNFKVEKTAFEGTVDGYGLSVTIE